MMRAVQEAKGEILAHMTSTVRCAGESVAVALLFATAVIAFSAVASAQGPWKVLFDGKDLSNFTIATRRGTPAPALDAPSGWRVQDGVIIGGGQSSVMRSGALATNEKYFDFELELEFLLAEIGGVKCTEELGPKGE